ncbi:MAG: ribosomal RNA small subunit methyltransferase A [Gemmatimonadetes bacterium]|nr:ribosomal RNA small subunit methyltransferase A [Gemmatimonadota bacterium]
MGQNFLVNPRVLDRIADAAALTGSETVVEIGPGKGALTERLAERAGRVIAVELDRRLAEGLENAWAGSGQVTIVRGDFLQYDLTQNFSAESRGIVLGNVPYSITSPIVFRLFEQAAVLDRALLLVQREVADRMTAGPGDRARGRLGVAVEYYAKANRLFLVGPANFRPRPRVDSALVSLRFHAPRDKPAFERRMFALVKRLFGERRKMIRAGLREWRPGLDTDSVEAESGVALTRRPETLTLDEWRSLARAAGDPA